MSKKIAGGANGIVLDVKVGEGAFMRELENAQELAKIMVEIGADAGRDVVAVISDMNQPLGQAVGNALELREAIDTLNGGGPAEFRQHCLEIAKHMVMLAGRGQKWTDADTVLKSLTETLDSGTPLLNSAIWSLPRGDANMIDDPGSTPVGSRRARRKGGAWRLYLPPLRRHHRNRRYAAWRWARAQR